MHLTLLFNELKKWEITPEYEFGHITLKGGDKAARKHYSEMFKANPEIEINFILELAKINEEVYQQIEERAAIRWADGLPDDFESAVRCNF